MKTLGEFARLRLKRWGVGVLLLAALTAAATLPRAAEADDPPSSAPSAGTSTTVPKDEGAAPTAAPDSLTALRAASEHPADSKAQPDTTRGGAAPAPAPPTSDQGAPASPAKKPEGKPAEPESKPQAEKPAEQPGARAPTGQGDKSEAKPGAEKPAEAEAKQPADKTAATDTKQPAEKTAATQEKPQDAGTSGPESKQTAGKSPPPEGKTSPGSAGPAPKTPGVKSSAGSAPPAKASRESRPAKRRASGSSTAKHHATGPATKKGSGGSASTKAPARKPAASAERNGAADAPPDPRHASSSVAAATVVPGGELSEGDRVAREIQRTEFWMRRAGGVVPRSRNSRAIDLLGTADQFQHDARGAYDLKQYARAQRLTQAARDYADRATRLVGPATDDPEYVKSVLERTDDALDRLKDVLHSANSDREQAQYESLKDDQKGAWKLFHSDDVHGAFAATTRVRDGVLAVLQRLPEAPVSCDAAEKAIKNAEGARENAAEDIGAKPSAEASRRLQQADGQIAKAHALLDHGDCKEALLRAKAAEQQLERAVDAARPSR